jgi:hypothetical protein
VAVLLALRESGAVRRRLRCHSFTAVTGCESPWGRHFGTELRTVNVAGRAPEAAASVCNRLLFDPMILTSPSADLDVLGECPEVVAAVAATGNPYPLTGGGSELPHHGPSNRLLAGAFEHGDPSGHGSACLARQRERQVQFHPVVHDLRYDPAALAAFEADQAVALHRAQRAREVGFGLAGDPRQLVE